MATEAKVGEAALESLDALQSVRNSLDRERDIVDKRTRALTTATIVAIGAAPVAFFLGRWVPATQPWFGAALVLYALIAVAFVPMCVMRRTELDGDIQDIDFQIDLQRFEVAREEGRAEKILHANDARLRRYYDMNLSQNSWVFGLGVGCIVLGAVVIGVTLYLVLKVAKTPDAQWATAALGGVGSLFTNAVAAVYLKMHSSASENLAGFHAKLVETNRLLLANLFASRISNAAKRNDTLSKIAIGLTEVAPEKGSDSAET